MGLQPSRLAGLQGAAPPLRPTIQAACGAQVRIARIAGFGECTGAFMHMRLTAPRCDLSNRLLALRSGRQAPSPAVEPTRGAHYGNAVLRCSTLYAAML